MKDVGNILDTVIIAAALVASGAVLTVIWYESNTYEPCWETYVDVRVEAWYQETLDDPWNFDDGRFDSHFKTMCAPVEGQPGVWRTLSIREMVQAASK